MTKIMLFTLLSLGSVNSANAQANNVRDLLAFCEAPSGSQLGYCYGMVAGAMGVMSSNCALGFGPAVRFTAGTTVEAGVQAFINWARANPQEWQLSSSMGLMVSLPNAFPCSRD